MKKTFFKMFVLGITFICFSFFSCSFFSKEEDEKQKNNSGETEQDEPEVIGEKADAYFLGTWIRMDNGEEYQVLGDKVAYGGKKYTVTSSSSSSITVKTLGTFEKESDGVMKMEITYAGATTKSVVPFFRKGGANPKYSLKVVGFSDNIARAGISSSGSKEVPKKGIRVTGESTIYNAPKASATSDEDGIITLTAVASGDVQKLSVDSESEKLTLSEIQVNNNNDFLGKIPLVGENEAALKITGTVGANHDGYLYAEKTYPMTLLIENISKIDNKSARASISAGKNLTITNKDSVVTDLNSFSIPTMAPGFDNAKKIDIEVTCGTFYEPYFDTEIQIEIVVGVGDNKRVWVDSVPLRIFRGQMPITISVKNAENNENARLNGFIIYPDGNNKFFSISNNSSETLLVPVFKNSENYMLAFSGATSSGKMADSTEMFYTVNIDSVESVEVVTAGSVIGDFQDFGEFGGGNEREDSATIIDSDKKQFEAYLHSGDRDFYKIAVESDSAGYLGADSVYKLSVKSVSDSTVTLEKELKLGELSGSKLYVNGQECYYSSTNYENKIYHSYEGGYYYVKGLETNKSYTFQLRDLDGKIQSNSVTATTNECSITCYNVTSSSIILSFTNNKRVSGTKYVYANDKYMTSVTYSEEKYISVYIDGLVSGETYVFALKNKKSSSADFVSNSVEIKTETHPVISYYGDGKRYITWSAVTGATAYKVYYGVYDWKYHNKYGFEYLWNSWPSAEIKAGDKLVYSLDNSRCGEDKWIKVVAVLSDGKETSGWFELK